MKTTRLRLLAAAVAVAIGVSSSLPAVAATPPDAGAVTDIRASRVIGADVYNEKDQKVGTINDIILGRGDARPQVVLAVGGVLGLGAKLVAVPYNRLQFGTTHGSADDRVLMPGATTASVNAMSDFHYAGNG